MVIGIEAIDRKASKPKLHVVGSKYAVRMHGVDWGIVAVQTLQHRGDGWMLFALDRSVKLAVMTTYRHKSGMTFAMFGETIGKVGRPCNRSR